MNLFSSALFLTLALSIISCHPVEKLDKNVKPEAIREYDAALTTVFKGIGRVEAAAKHSKKQITTDDKITQEISDSIIFYKCTADVNPTDTKSELRNGFIKLVGGNCPVTADINVTSNIVSDHIELVNSGQFSITHDQIRKINDVSSMNFKTNGTLTTSYTGSQYTKTFMGHSDISARSAKYGDLSIHIDSRIFTTFQNGGTKIITGKRTLNIYFNNSPSISLNCDLNVNNSKDNSSCVFNSTKIEPGLFNEYLGYLGMTKDIE